jgi:hypothetical protein
MLLGMDTMMRRINKWLWPYMSIVMYNELNKICVACEAIMLAERSHAYMFMVKFLFENAPGRRPQDVLVVAGDGFFTQAKIEEWGFSHARLLQDWHHLFTSGLSDRFGKTGYALIKTELSQMMRASSEQYFTKALENARLILTRAGQRQVETEAKLESFASKRHEYAQYCIDMMPGSRGRHGSSNSESNHSSVLCHMNDGHKKTNEYNEEVITLVKDLLGRQNYHCIEMNRLLYDDEKLLVAECEKLRQLSRTSKNKDLFRAAHSLCRVEYEFYKKARKESVAELSLVTNDDGTFTVTSNKPNDEPIRFQSRDDSCMSCRESVSMQRQCKHEICLCGTLFVKDRWLIRHMRRSRMSRSIIGWRPVPSNAVAEQLGLSEDTPDQHPDEGSNMPTIDGEEACLDDGTEDIEDDGLHDLTTNKCRPLTTSAFQIVASQVSSFYDGCADRVKLVVGAMMITMRDLIVTDGKVNNTIDTSEGVESTCLRIVRLHNSAFANSTNVFTPVSSRALTVQRPPAALIARAKPNRLKRKNDQQTARNTRNAAMGNISAVVLSGVRANKKRGLNKCSFCGLNAGHKFTWCPKRLTHKTNASGVPFLEHDMNAAEDRTVLTSTIESTMTMSGTYNDPPVGTFSELTAAWHKASFIIKEARPPAGGGLGGGVWSMSQIVFRVDFIAKDGTVDAIMQNKWVTGSVMMAMITPRGLSKKPLPKFAYDHTSMTGPSIRQTMSLSQQIMSLSQQTMSLSQASHPV